MKGLKDTLAEHAFFEGLQDEHLNLIAGCGQIAGYSPGEYLSRAGTPAVSFFLVRHGKVALELTVPGRDPFIFETVSEDGVIGWSWLFAPHVSQYDARAVERVSAICFDGACLRGKCESDPLLGYELMKRFSRVLVQRFSDTRLQLLDVYGNQD